MILSPVGVMFNNMDSSILWVLIGAWGVTCAYYLYRLMRIAKGKGISFLSLVTQTKRSPYSRTRKIFRNIFIATAAFILGIAIIYFVQSSS
jgi:hypothetical protein